VDKQLRGAQTEILTRYEKWKDIVKVSGPQGLRLIKGLHDEALGGKLAGLRSSRLGLKFRVIYRVVPSEQLFQVTDVTPHEYRKA